MPYKLRKPCAYPRCPALTHERFCPEHKRQHNHEYEQTRPSPKARGYNERWTKLRRQHLQLHPWCADCAEVGIKRPATEVHHIQDTTTHPERFYDPSNLRSLCKSCHSRHTAKEHVFGR